MVCRFFIIHYLHKKAYGAETVVARKHSRIRIFHPSVEKVAATLRQLFHERQQRLPSTIAQAVGFLAVPNKECLPNYYVASVSYRVFVFLHKVGIFGFPYGGNLYCLHRRNDKKKAAI